MTIGPITPVCVVGKPCVRPAAHVALAFSRGRRTVRVETDARGGYRVSLAPGTWSVRTSAGRRIAPARIVVAGASRRLDLAIDTGIR